MLEKARSVRESLKCSGNACLERRKKKGVGYTI